MESPQNLKKRLKSVNNVNQITKAMEMVSATKMRKSQQIAIDSRPYAFASLDLLANISKLEKHLPELLEKRKVRNTLFVLVASDKGLAGAFNSSIFKKFDSYISHATHTGKKEFVAVGEKSFSFLEKKGLPVLNKFVNVGDFTTTEEVQPIADFLVSGYLEKKWDCVIIFSTHFRSALKQEPLVRKVLPVSSMSIKKTINEIIPEKGKFAELIKEHGLSFGHKSIIPKDVIIEPSPEKVLKVLASHLVFMQLYQLILEANASEHAARRMAMKAAADNASKLSFNLNLQYNKSRQSAITREIIEITVGSQALE